MINQSNKAGEQSQQKHHGHFHIPDEIRHLGDMSLYRAVAWWGFLRKTEFTRDDVSQAFQIDLRRSSGILSYICHRHGYDDITFEMRKIPVQGGCCQLAVRILKVATSPTSVRKPEKSSNTRKDVKTNNQLDQLMARWMLSRPTGNNATQLEAWKAGCPIYDNIKFIEE
ncbi:CaiF/GrlA family transcriptional regulator [Citrobacter sp. wls718]|uniref:CaiF/GrlA family transcriptional regulator n=1 Tax=Citrobacter sp. wls718 TaxID=2576418 RepID=UPI000DF8E606|nr:CaiF/GrlA family transcriptional regulator [Citrobacter sp. wls718]TKU37188.1 CaiF/GrlA family transcriptional regulator [Citrobacter sp. wls718]STE16977.1 positive regulator GrlA [Escherichia coli]